MKKILVASNNGHKIIEIKEMLSDLNLEVMGLKEAGIDIDVEETGTTFAENAYIKAKAIYDIISNKEDYMVLSDDSGIAVDALNGEPGVYSARFAGEHGNSKKNNEKLLKLMEGIHEEKRGAKFVCAIVLVYGESKYISVEGIVEGRVTDREYGNDGFGYDPIFFVPELNKTFGEASAEEKNSISHRARALVKLKEEISKIL